MLKTSERTVTTAEGLAWALKTWTATKPNSRFQRQPGNPLQTVPNRSADPMALAPVEIEVGGGEARHVTHDRARSLHQPGSTPVVIRGAAADWVATGRWSLDFFAEYYGDHVVPIDGRDEHGDTRTASLRECVERTRDGDGGYTRFSPLMAEQPELVDDLDLEALAAMSGADMKRMLYQLFIGGAGTRTETHCAVGNNAFVQVHGEKTWYFVAPVHTASLRPLPLGRPYFASTATLHDPSLPTHPDALVYPVHLRAGDVLLIPPFWWHQVDNPTESIGVASRWHHPAHFLSQSVFLTLMTLSATNPNVVRANADRRRFGFVYQETVEQAHELVDTSASR